MAFTSYSFIGSVALLFLVYYLIPKKMQWPLLLITSYVFYWNAGHEYLLYIGITTLITYFMSREISKLSIQKHSYLKENKETLDRDARQLYENGIRKKQRVFMRIALFVDLGLLIVMKYTNFILENVNGILAHFNDTSIAYVDLILPLGISFYTFQSIAYLMDVYEEKYEAQMNLPKFALFIGFFPQLSQGPISRYDDLSKTLFEEHSFNKQNVSFGLQRILWGYFKKLVIADRVAVALKTIMAAPTDYEGVGFFMTMLFFALQLYADFTGGIDITIGIAEVMGIKIQENFLRPYFSTSIKEYWRRWHISMGTWFRDYVMYPLMRTEWMGKLRDTTKKKWGKKASNSISTIIGTTVVWLATGIWHGASWNRVLWGMLNCAIIILSQELSPVYKKFHDRFHLDTKGWYQVFMMLRTFCLMSVLRMFECYTDVPLTFHLLGGLFTQWNMADFSNGMLLNLGLSTTDYLILGFGILLMFLVSLVQTRDSVRVQIANLPYVCRFVLWLGLFLLVIVLGAYGHGYDASQFIYNQF